MNSITLSLMLIAIGLVAMLRAVLNWRIVCHFGKLLNRVLGVTVARAVYGAVGVDPIVQDAMRLRG